MNLGVFRWVQGIIQIMGGDGTNLIGNTGNSIHTIEVPGTDKASPAFTLAAGSQTKDIEALVGSVTIDLNEKFNMFLFHVASLRLYKWRAAYIDNADVTPVETEIGIQYTDAGHLGVKLEREKFGVDTNGGTGTQKIALYATPLDKVEEIYAQFEFNQKF